MRMPRRRRRRRASAMRPGCGNLGRPSASSRRKPLYGRSMPAAARLRSAYNSAIRAPGTGMFAVKATQSTTKAGLYEELAEQARGLLAGERDRIANAANFASLVFNAVPAINWCGFYFFDGTELV